MEIRLAHRYRLWMWLLLPLTLGVGTLLLWLHARQWPRRIERGGLELRSGRFVPWQDIKRMGVTKRHFDDEMVRVDLYCQNGKIQVPAAQLQYGDKVGEAIRALVQHARRETMVPERPVLERARRAASIGGAVAAARRRGTRALAH
jgi:hypothetical protein